MKNLKKEMENKKFGPKQYFGMKTKDERKWKWLEKFYLFISTE